ncbi:ectonucleotide pyrophosphatase/phosphodiesterase [Mucilaginibacter sp. CSA2-8R]|uniref:alkaline phosphatase family protein n=1 Tax=Mucilaginibacter sp. CSA2-8R TaxID=3141542 RepID=UPI00315D5146
MVKNSIALLLTLLINLSVYAQNTDTLQQVVSGRANSLAQQAKPYVILISVDGMRYDYAEKYQARHLLALSAGGVKAKAMLPSYPSITFPNHYTLITGLYPAHTGLVCNRFYDRRLNAAYSSKSATATEARWYGGTPLWVLAEKQKMVTASFYWVGSDAPIQGTYPTYRFKYNEQIGINSRIHTVVNWLKLPPEKRPHLINLYFPQVDHAGHYFGPDAPQTRQAVLFIDSAINELQKQVKQTGLEVNFILLSDHGMTKSNNNNPFTIPASIDTSKFRITGEDVLVEVYAKDSTNIQAIQSTYKALKTNAPEQYDVYLRTHTPAQWHYNKANDRYNRIGDILLVPKAPYVFIYSANAKHNPGTHGYDPRLVPEMKASFFAWGPAFKKRSDINEFENVEVYPVVAQLLGLKITQPVDGSNRLARKILKSRRN